MFSGNASLFFRKNNVILQFLYRWSTELYTISRIFWRNFIICYMLEHFWPNFERYGGSENVNEVC